MKERKKFREHSLIPKFKVGEEVLYAELVHKIESMFPEVGGWYYFLEDGCVPVTEKEIKKIKR